MAGAVPQVAARGFEVDAQCGRQLATGMAMIRSRKAAGTLPRMVVWALGTNGPQTLSDVGRLRALVGTRRRIVLVTPRGPVPWVPTTQRAYRAAARTWESVVLADWAAFSSGHGGWLAPDGIHLQASGAAGMARLLARSLRFYPRPPGPEVPPFQPIPAPSASATPRPSVPAALATPPAAPAGPGPSAAGTRAAFGCGGTVVQAPTRRRVRGRAPLVIGDSVLLGAVGPAAAAGYLVNAHGCRQIGEGTRVVRELKGRGLLPRLVVVQLGTNGTIRAADIDRLLRLLGSDRTLGLITSRSVDGDDNASARAMRAAAARRPDRIALVDWQRSTQGRRGWFQPDGIHLTPRGASGLAGRLRSLLRFAAPAPGPTAPSPPAFQPIPAPAAPTI
jgi:lysophospholipase L1-like esterase